MEFSVFRSDLLKELELVQGAIESPTLPTFHLSGNPPRKGSNRRAMSEVPESSVGAGRREAKGGRNSPWPTGRT